MYVKTALFKGESLATRRSTPVLDKHCANPKNDVYLSFPTLFDWRVAWPTQQHATNTHNMNTTSWVDDDVLVWCKMQLLPTLLLLLLMILILVIILKQLANDSLNFIVYHVRQ